jgi:hypothetical protein
MQSRTTNANWRVTFHQLTPLQQQQQQQQQLTQQLVLA